MATREELEELVKDINKELKISIGFGDEPEKRLKRISTGEPLLDGAIGGGIPRRGVTLIIGNESTGKTYLCQRIAASAQREGLTVALIDTEYSYDPDWFAKSGIDISKLLHLEPESAESALDTVIELCKREIDIVIIDSVAALLPEVEDEKGMGEQQMGLQARLVNKFLRKVTRHNKSTAIIMVNQLRQGIGPYAGVTAPGGRGQHFWSKIRIELKREDWIWEEGKSSKSKGAIPIGFYIGVKTSKNKTSTPQLTCEIPFYFSGDTDTLLQMVQVAQTYGIITQAGPYYTFKDKKFLGRPKLLDAFRDDEKLLEVLLLETQESIKNDN